MTTRPHSPEQAKLLCNNEDKCKGFAFTSSNDVIFKNDVTGKIIPKSDVTLYIKKEHAQGLELPLTGDCAVPVDDRILSNFSGGCNLAEFDPFDRSVMQYIHKPELPIKCEGKRLTRYRNGVLEFMGKDTRIDKAEYVRITRIHQNDWGFNEGNSKSLDPHNVNKVNDEFIRVATTTQDGGKHTEFHAAVVPKPDVVARSRSNTGLPVNVMIVGIDSISSAHFQRALPEAYKYLTDDLKSIVMKGYTIVGDGTTPALTALLTGELPPPQLC
ncbi:hypothetical protein QZH41_019501 [Actinostola sp. cb2023]|nr:hypothetical protein QZH41_019501 [Actinostola sp. cb2023]